MFDRKISQRKAIWGIYLAEFGLSAEQQRSADSDWRGAEIRSCCLLAALWGCSLREAAQNVVPVACTAAEARNDCATGQPAAACRQIRAKSTAASYAVYIADH